MMSQIATPAVRGVPAFFVRSWLVDNLMLLGAVVGVLGGIDLFLALANLGLGDPLAMLVNLVLGVVELAAAAILLGMWRPDAVTLDRMSTACMAAMWLTAAWSVFTFAGMVAVQGVLAVLGLILTVVIMMVLGSAAAVIKNMARNAS